MRGRVCAFPVAVPIGRGNTGTHDIVFHASPSPAVAARHRVGLHRRDDDRCRHDDGRRPGTDDDAHLISAHLSGEWDDDDRAHRESAHQTIVTLLDTASPEDLSAVSTELAGAAEILMTR
ncbi:hypothetical protein [Corynebacterium variabile]